MSERNIFPNSKGVNFACQKGKVKIVQWCFERGILPNEKGIDYAYGQGNPEMLKWITTKRFIPGIKSIHCICERGDLYLLEKISENVLPNRISANKACRYGHVNVLQWLFEKGILPDTDGANFDVLENHVDVLEWLEKYVHILPTEMGVTLAYEYGNFDVIVFLKKGFSSREERSQQCI